MKDLNELKNLRVFLQTLIAQEESIKNALVEKIYLFFPRDVASTIVEKVNQGQSPIEYVNEHVRFEKEKNSKIYGKVIWMD